MSAPDRSPTTDERIAAALERIATALETGAAIEVNTVVKLDETVLINTMRKAARGPSLL